MPPGRRPTPPRPRGATGFQPPKKNPASASAYGDRYAAQAKMWDDQSEKDAYSAAQNAGGPAAAADPWGNMTPDQYFAALMGAGGLGGLIFGQRHRERMDQQARGLPPGGDPFTQPPSPTGGLVNNGAIEPP